MIDLLGLISILLVSLIYTIIGLRYSDIFSILFVGLVVRILVISFGYLIPLPDSGADSRSFEILAWSLAQDGFFNVFNNYPGFDSRFYGFMMAIPYSLFGRSILMLKSISLFFGMGCIFLSWSLAKKIYNESIAKNIGWIVALFPTLILYSALTMREVYISFFLLVAIYGIIGWVRTESFTSIILAMFGFICTGLFHGSMLVGGIFFLIIVLFLSFKKFLKLLRSLKVDQRSLIIIIASVIILSFFFTNKINIPKIGTFETAINISGLMNKVFHKSDSSYPDFLKINSTIEFIYKSPIRAVYFLFSPFPWDVNKTSHIIGLIDSLLYIILVYLIFRNLKVILNDPALIITFLILACYFFIFGVGVDSFGTGIRHRSKFVIAMILLAAPLIPKISMRRHSNVSG
jgi:hypothetical protein